MAFAQSSPRGGAPKFARPTRAAATWQRPASRHLHSRPSIVMAPPVLKAPSSVLGRVHHAVVAVPKAHLHNMTARFGKTSVPWGRRYSVWAGCSGALFVVPGLVGLNHDPSSVVVAACFLLQSVLSVQADYVHHGRDSVWHGLDRWFASMMTVGGGASSVADTRHVAVSTRGDLTPVFSPVHSACPAWLPRQGHPRLLLRQCACIGNGTPSSRARVDVSCRHLQSSHPRTAPSPAAARAGVPDLFRPLGALPSARPPRRPAPVLPAQVQERHPPR